MSKIKLAGAGAKYAGKKISEVLKRLKRNKAAKKSKANIEKIGRGTKSISRYNIRARAADEKVIPVKGQSQKGSSFKPHKVRGTGPGSRVGFETRESWRDEMERMYSDISISKFFKKSTGGDINKPMKKKLSEKQKKIASKAPPYDQIGGNDFAVLKKEKAKGRGMGLQDESVKPGKVMKAKRGKLGEAKDYKNYLKGLKKATSEVRGAKLNSPAYNITTYDQKTFEKAGGKGKAVFKDYKGLGIKNEDQYFKEKNKFLKRPKVLSTVGKVAKSTRLGRTAALVGAGLGAAAAGIGKAVKQYKDYKSAKNRDAAKVSKNRMGGGMMKRPMGYSKGGGYDAGVPGKVRDIVNKSIKIGNRITEPEITKKDMKMLSEVGRTKLNKIIKSKKFMGGGMMMKPMGYSKGTMIMARGCKLGRKKATKIT